MVPSKLYECLNYFDETVQLLITDLSKQSLQKIISKPFIEYFFSFLQDMDHDGRLNYTDFQQAVEDNALLLEILGQCFPNEEVSVKMTKKGL